MTVSGFLDSLFAGFDNLPTLVLLVVLISIAARIGLTVIWEGRKERITEIKREDRIAAQGQRDWDWLERSERGFERKSNLDEVHALDASEDIDPIAELRRLLAEYKKPTEEDK